MAEFKALEWDKTGEHFYETGIQKLALYLVDSNNAYTNGVAWNGVTSISESPSGGDETALWADNTKYLSLRSKEDFGCTIEAYTYPEEFEQCDGTADLVAGVKIGQQTRKSFGLCYRTEVGNDTMNEDYGYKLHLVYGCTCNPSERSYQTINDSPEAITFSWEIKTVPVAVTGAKPTSIITIDSKKVAPEALAQLETILYGSSTAAARLPLPDEIKQLFA